MNKSLSLAVLSIAILAVGYFSDQKFQNPRTGLRIQSNTNGNGDNDIKYKNSILF